jgi:hypothetical protein
MAGLNTCDARLNLVEEAAFLVIGEVMALLASSWVDLEVEVLKDDSNYESMVVWNWRWRVQSHHFINSIKFASERL